MDDLPGDLLRIIHLHLQLVVHRYHVGAVHRRTGGARRDIEHLDLAVGQLAAQRLGEAAQGELAGAVGGEAGVADGAESRAEIDQQRSRLLAQQGQQQVGQLQGGGDVDADQPGDGVLVLLFEQAELIDPGGVDHTVEPAKAARGLQHQLSPAALGEVCRDQADLPRVTAGQAFQRNAVAPHQQQPGTAGAEPFHQQLADTAAGTGEQEARVRQVHGRAPPREGCGRCRHRGGRPPVRCAPRRPCRPRYRGGSSGA